MIKNSAFYEWLKEKQITMGSDPITPMPVYTRGKKSVILDRFVKCDEGYEAFYRVRKTKDEKYVEDSFIISGDESTQRSEIIQRTLETLLL